MTEKPRSYKFFSPPRWSVFETLPAVENSSQKSGRKRRYFPVPEGSCCTPNRLSGGTEVNSTFSIEKPESLQNVTFEIPISAKENKAPVEDSTTTESPCHNSSILDERELESTFCLPEDNATFSITAKNGKKSNLCAPGRESMKTHTMITRQTGKPEFQEPYPLGVCEPWRTVGTDETFKLASYENMHKLKSRAQFCQESNTAPYSPSRASCKSNAAIRRSSRIKLEENKSSLSAISKSPCNSTQEVCMSTSHHTRINHTKSHLNKSVLSKTESTGSFALGDLQMKSFTPSASSSPTKKKTLSGGMDGTFTLGSSPVLTNEEVHDVNKEVLISASKDARKKRFFPSPTIKASPVSDANSMLSGEPESSLMLATSGSTFELPSQGSRVFIKEEKNVWSTLADISEKSPTVVDSSEVSALRRSTRTKGKGETSVTLENRDFASRLPLHGNGVLIKREINTEVNAAVNFPDLPLDSARSGDNVLAVKVEKTSLSSSVFETSENLVPRVQRAAKRRAKRNLTNSMLQSADLTNPSVSNMSLFGANASSLSSVPMLPSNSLTLSASCANVKTGGKKSDLTVPTVSQLGSAVGALTDISLATYFSRTVTMADNKENMLNEGKVSEIKTSPTKEVKQPAQKCFKSRIPVPTKKPVCKETFQSKLPVSFKFRNAGPGSNLRTTATKQRSADKVIPFQFSAKPVPLTSKPTVHARAFAEHREKAATERRMTARCIASKSAPKDRNGKAITRQKLYHEMVRTNRTHELMLRRRV